jgi:hypothetical protein
VDFGLQAASSNAPIQAAAIVVMEVKYLIESTI